MQGMSPRYQAAMAQLSARVQALRSLTDGPQPTTMDELGQALDTAFVGGAYRLDTLNARRNRLSGAAEISQAGMDRDQREAASLERSISTAAQDMAGYAARMQAAKVRRANGDAARAAMAPVTAALDKRTEAVATSMVQWITVAAPPQARLISAADVKARARFDRGQQIPDIYSDAVPAVLRPTYPSLPPGPENPVAFRAPPGGSVADKLAAVEALPARIDAASRAVDAADLRVSSLQNARDDLTLRLNTLRERGRAVEDAVSSAKWRTDTAENRANLAVQNAQTEAGNMLVASVESSMMKTWRDKFAIPAAKEFLKSNQATAAVRLFTDREVAAYYAAGRTAITTTTRSLKDVKRFLSVQRVIQGYMQNPASYITDSVEVNASGDAPGAAAMMSAICRGNAKFNLDITKKAAGDLPGPAGEMARRMIPSSCE
jgi:hypothetical protein